MGAKVLFFRKIEARKPQVMEIAAETGLLNLASPSTRELISKLVMEDAVQVGLGPVAGLSVLRGRLGDLKDRLAARRQRVSLALSRFSGTVQRDAPTRFGRLIEGLLDAGSVTAWPLLLACTTPRIALLRASLNRVEIRDLERQRIRDAAAEMLLSMFEHYRGRGAAAAALKGGGLNQYA